MLWKKNEKYRFPEEQDTALAMKPVLRRVHTIHNMSIDMSIDIVAPQISIVRRCLHLNRHVVKQNHSTVKIYHYRNKKQPGFFSVYPTLNVHTAVCWSTFFIENRQNVD